MQTQILTKINGYDVEIELDKHSEFCSALIIISEDDWRVFEFQLRDVPCEEYAEEVVWDHGRQTPIHKRISGYDPFAEGFEYIEEEVKDFVASKPLNEWKQLEQ